MYYDDVELCDRVEVDGQGGVVRGSCPVGVVGGVQDIVGTVAASAQMFAVGDTALGYIVSEDAVALGAEGHKHGAVFGGYKSSAVGRYIQ